MTTEYLKYFTEDGIRGLQRKDKTRILMPDLALKLGYIIGMKYWQPRRHRVVIGKATMLHGYGIEPALTAGLVAMGMDPYLLGPAPTPSVSMHVRSLRANFGIMISVGERPYDQISIKLFGSDGLEIPTIDKVAIDNLLEADLSEEINTGREWGRAKRVDGAEQRYSEHLRKTISQEIAFDGLRIAIDCANGALYKIIEPLLDELGAEVFQVNSSPDGFNINQNCGFCDGRKLVDLVHRVRADIGFAFNGDGDDFVVITEADHEEGERKLTGDEIALLLEQARKECQQAAEVNGSAADDVLMQALQILATLKRSRTKLSGLVESLRPQLIKAVA
jgi:phosphoglucosamine mutase